MQSRCITDCRMEFIRLSKEKGVREIEVQIESNKGTLGQL